MASGLLIMQESIKSSDALVCFFRLHDSFFNVTTNRSHCVAAYLLFT